MTLKTPPGPRGDLFLGSTLDFKAHPAKYIRYVAQTYGDVTRFRVGPAYWYLVTHPEDIHDMMIKRGHIFLKPKIAKRLWDKFLGDGLLTTEGKVWERQSRLVRPAFRRSRVHAYGSTMVEYTHRMIDRWEDGQRVDMAEAMAGVTLEIVAKTLFDADVHAGTSTIAKAMVVLQKEMLEHIYMPLPVPRWWPSEANKRKLKAIADIEDIVQDVVDDRRASGEDHGDLLSMLLQPDETGDRLSDKELRDQAMTLFFAGHETTANAMAWAWMLFAQHPEVTQRIQTDLAEVTGGDRIDVKHLPDLPYLDWCVKECLRLRPSVWVFIKEPTEDVEMRGFKIPKGAPVLISPYVTQLDERWFPSPQTFIPERFSPERAKSIPKGAYVPFSGGKRVCLGQGFAMMEMKLILGSMLQRLRPRLADGYVPAHKAELSMHPDGGLPSDVLFR
jgi:cytochrome P450